MVFNGGGGYSSGYTDFNNCTGGGATDIRLASGNWNDFNSLKSRIMVAAGGGGNVSPVTLPGYGGGLTSKTADGAYPESTYGIPYGEVSGATQTSGYSFGIGQTGDSEAQLVEPVVEVDIMGDMHIIVLHPAALHLFQVIPDVMQFLNHPLQPILSIQVLRIIIPDMYLRICK